MANHKRGRPKSRRGGCLMCKYWKSEAASTADRSTPADRRQAGVTGDELEGCGVIPQRCIVRLGVDGF